MTMRLNPTYKNKIKDWAKGVSIIYIVMAGLYLLNLILTSIYPDNRGSFSGMESITYIFLLVSGIVMFVPNLKLAFANGISRKTEFVASLLGALTISAFMTVMNFGVATLYSTITNYQSIFDGMYHSFNFANNGVYHLTEFLFSVTSAFSSFLFGYFIGALYYRMNKALKIVVSVGVPIFLLVGLPILIGYFLQIPFFKKIITNVIDFVLTISANPYYAIISSILVSVILCTFSFLLIKKASIKEK